MLTRKISLVFCALLAAASLWAHPARERGDSTAGQRHIFLAGRSNALVPLSNLGLVIPVGNRLTIEGDFYTPWLWHDRKNSWCFELQGADIELRWWFSPFEEGYKGNALKGHSLSVGALAGHYDFERNWKGFQGEFYGAYAGYAYTFFIARFLRLQIGLSVGWMRTTRKDYQVYAEYGKLIRTEPLNNNLYNWFGPVKASVSLIVPADILVRNNNKKK